MSHIINEYPEMAETEIVEAAVTEQGIKIKGKWRQGLLPLHLVFLLCAVLFIVLGSYLQHLNFKIGILATEFGMLVIPAIIYMKVKKQSVRDQFKFKMPLKSDFLKVAVAGIFLVPFVGLMNAFVNLWLLYGLHIQAPIIPTETGVLGPLISLGIVAMTPGFCEEFFFRGLLLTEYEKKMSLFQAALLSALLFGLFHYNVMNFFGPVVLGLVFAWTMQVTGSILLAMFGHFINNAFAVVMLYATVGIKQDQSMQAIEQIGNLWPLVVVGALFVLIIIAVPCFFVTTFLLKSIRKQHLHLGDQLKVNGVNYSVANIEGRTLLLTPEREAADSDSENESKDEDEGEDKDKDSMTLDYSHLYRNNRVILKNKHWASFKFTYKIKLSEWWPIIICAIMYIGINALSLALMIKEAAAV